MEKFLNEYQGQIPKYTSLKEQIVHVLINLAKQKSIELFGVEGRVKTVESLKNKLALKKYERPEDEVEDLCGVRVICYYESDLDLLERIIREEFCILSETDKLKEIEDDRFGYSSRHFVVKVKDSWLDMPLFREVGGLKVEIQIRTMLMHTWAAISHKLLYKKEGDAPREIKRSLSKLSALIEMADEQFDSIRNKKENYLNVMTSAVESQFLDEPLNSDNLILLVKKYTPERDYYEESIPMVLEEIKLYDKTVKDFEERIKSCLPFLGPLEAEEAGSEFNLPLWNIEGYCRTVLELTCDDYFTRRWKGHEDHVMPTIKFRGLLKDSTK